jgi:hypothetical protein
MAAFVFNQTNGTLLSAISATWAGDVSTLEVQSSKLQDSLGGAYAAKMAYLNEAGSSYAVAKYSASSSVSPNQYTTYIRSATGVNTSGYDFRITTTSGNFYRNNTYVATYNFAASHDASTTATEIKVEQVGADVRVYGGPIGATTLIGTYTDGSPLSGGYSGFYLVGGGAVTPSITAFDNGTTVYTYARPTSDITTQWTPSTGIDHYALIDETTANDADYIYATAAGQTDEVRLASMSAPQAGTDLLINYKVAGIVGSASVTMSLRQGSGGTLIATDTAKTSDNTYQLVVPAATWASVTDWTDLRLRFVSA